MSTRVVDRVGQWAERSFAGGYRGLQQLVTAEFSGVVRADGVEVYLTRGVAVGVRGGDIDDIEDASGSAREAPSPALPLLAVMQGQEAESRDSFYTEQTPVEKVDSTLSEGGFTGYVELSENVLSGDYYLVYHAGERSSVAFVGESERLLTDDEAFETAADEVGIYRVYPADVTAIDLPVPGSAGEPATPAVEEREATATPETGADEATPEQAADAAAGEADTGDGESAAADVPADGQAAPDTVRTIPSLEPGRTAVPEREGEDTSEASESDGQTRDGQAAGAHTAGGSEATDRARRRIEELEAERDRLEARVAELEAERDQLDTRREELEAERDRLEARVAELEAERDRLEGEPATADGHGETTGGRAVTAQDARAETKVFLRYRSQGDVTLDTVHQGGGDRETLQRNLRLEVYGGFDEQVTVEGRPYEAFVAETPAYQFAAWVVGTLPFEIRETGNTDALGGVYDAVPEIDHVDLSGTVSLSGTEAESASFDAVFRNQREQPLALARIDGTEGPVTETQAEQLLTEASAVDSLGAAFLVTGSHFTGPALEAVEAATASGLLSRSSRKSFVSRSRTQGFHLCLVEMRDDVSHLVFPEL